MNQEDIGKVKIKQVKLHLVFIGAVLIACMLLSHWVKLAVGIGFLTNTQINISYMFHSVILGYSIALSIRIKKHWIIKLITPIMLFVAVKSITAIVLLNIKFKIDHNEVNGIINYIFLDNWIWNIIYYQFFLMAILLIVFDFIITPLKIKKTVE
ncbi:hypothetical protein AAG747_21750 [Rapidithrix thailandica]|uniref:Uncharacterized protein n=1 Tax=Rapidithrix thailandica TaxID=413964 RepID=A0AAW9SDF8_9BACT